MGEAGGAGGQVTSKAYRRLTDRRTCRPFDLSVARFHDFSALVYRTLSDLTPNFVRRQDPERGSQAEPVSGEPVHVGTADVDDGGVGAVRARTRTGLPVACHATGPWCLTG